IGTGAGVDGFGSAGYFKDFWEYDPLTNTWGQKADFRGTARLFATGFSIANKGYIGAGLNEAGGIMKDIWQYDPLSNAWTRKADFPGITFGCGFSLGNKGYVGTKDFWEYDPF